MLHGRRILHDRLHFLRGDVVGDEAGEECNEDGLQGADRARIEQQVQDLIRRDGDLFSAGVPRAHDGFVALEIQFSAQARHGGAVDLLSSRNTARR